MQNVSPYQPDTTWCEPLFVLFGILAILMFVPSMNGQAITPSPFWKNAVNVPEDDFRVAGSSAGEPDWIKFTLLVDDPGTVYFQDSQEYTFHYEFALEELNPFRDMTVQEFSRYSLLATGQRAILGAVIMPPSHVAAPPNVHEYGIQLIRLDPFTREQVVDLFYTVKDSIVTGPDVEAFYFPSFEQWEVANNNLAWFASQGLQVSSTARWAPDNACYATGWALGRLVYIPAADITSAYQEGRLSPLDILLTNGVPVQVPPVAGIWTLAPSTPNSHVAILCRNYGVPFAYLNQDSQIQRAWTLEGNYIVMQAYTVQGMCDLRLIDVDGVLDETVQAEIQALKAAPELEIQPVTAHGQLADTTDALMPSDIRFFGGKAANFGFLRRAIPNNSPQAIAFTFDLWNTFLDQDYGGGDHTLREEIDMRLVPYRVYPPPDMRVLAHELRDIRESLFKDAEITRFVPELKAAILHVLTDPKYGFDRSRKLRFRSSTNVEDSRQFTGAGLYDSFSGCLLDDLDSNDQGPSVCDPAAANERGVLRAIRKVFASFYNDFAYLERIRHGVNESDVGMALLVHHSFPDEIELANGVATLSTGDDATWQIDLVTQAGAMSVSNPTNGSIPEVVKVNVAAQAIKLRLVQSSNVVLLGNKAMTWQDDYIGLSELITCVGDRYIEETGKTDVLLDFEYKKIAPEGKLVIKQVREIPRLGNVKRIVPFLVQDANRASEYVVYQGEYGNVFANHRLKSVWQLRTRSQWLEPRQLVKSLYASIQFSYLQDDQVLSLGGDPSQWPEYCHTYSDHTTTESWVLGRGRERRTYQLATSEVGKLVAPSQSAILVLNDLGKEHLASSGCLRLSVVHGRAMPCWNTTENALSTTDSDDVLLCPRPAEQEGEQHQKRSFVDDRGIAIVTSFSWPPPSPRSTAGNTAPLTRWHKTVIEGLTHQPIVLQGDYSQTYCSEHQNLLEHFLFEPRLEPGLPSEMLGELLSKNIRLIYFVSYPTRSKSRIITMGFDDDHSN